MPLESFSPPVALDGSRGVNRSPSRCQIDAGNDYQAIQAWLRARFFFKQKTAYEI